MLNTSRMLYAQTLREKAALEHRAREYLARVRGQRARFEMHGLGQGLAIAPQQRPHHQRIDQQEHEARAPAERRLQMRADHRRDDRRQPPRDRHVRERMQQRLTRERIGDDRLREQVRARDAEALQRTGEDERLEIRRRERQQTADRVDGQAEREHALAAIGVGDRTEDQLAERVGGHVAGDAGLDRLRRGAEVVRHGGQRGHVDVDGELSGGCEQADQE
ncbi:hypothetical protein OKW33_005417 [Paraburkholderia atlantica]